MGLFSSIGGLFGGNDAADDLQDALAEIAANTKFTPYNVNTPFFGVGPRGDGSIGITNSKRGLFTTFNDFAKLINQTGNRAKNFNAQNFQNDFFRSIDRLESQREQEGFADFESKLFNNAGVSTGSQRQVRDFQENLQQRRFDRQQRAVEASQQYQTNLFNQFLGLNTGRNALNQAVLNQFGVSQGLGNSALNAQLAANNLLTQGAQIDATATANTGSAIGGLLDGAFSLFGGGFF